MLSSLAPVLSEIYTPPCIFPFHRFPLRTWERALVNALTRPAYAVALARHPVGPAAAHFRATAVGESMTGDFVHSMNVASGRSLLIVLDGGEQPATWRHAPHSGHRRRRGADPHVSYWQQAHTSVSSSEDHRKALQFALALI
jgi:hypothetical protein